MSEIRKAIDATIESIENKINNRQSAIYDTYTAHLRCLLSYLKEFYPTAKKGEKNETSVRRKAQHTKNV